MGRPPKKSCNACCSPGSPDTPDTPDPPSSPTSCDDMINIVFLGSTLKSSYVAGRATYTQSRTYEETNNEYNAYRSAYPNRIHIVLEIFPFYLPGYIGKRPPKIRYPENYSRDTFDFSYYIYYGNYADKDQFGQANWWSRINQMINASSTEAQDLFNNSSQVCIDVLSDRNLINKLALDTTDIGFKYKTLLNSIRAAGKDIVNPVGERALTNRKLRTQAFFSGFTHHECCNSADASDFRKLLTATPDCFPTLSEEPDSEYTLELLNIKPDDRDISLFESACSFGVNLNKPIRGVKLEVNLLKGDQKIYDRAVSYVLQKRDIKATEFLNVEPNPLGDLRYDADGNQLDSFSDLFPLDIAYANTLSHRTINIEDTHSHSRIPLKYAKTHKVSVSDYQHVPIEGIDLLSITHPGDLGTQKVRGRLPLLKDYPENGDAKLFRIAHAPDWFKTYDIPVDFMAVTQRNQTKVFVKRPLIDFDTLSSEEFIYGGKGNPLCGTMEGTYTVGSYPYDTKNLAHFLLRTANEKDGENNLHLGNKSSEDWLQNEWVQIGDTISGGSTSGSEAKLACHRYTLNDSTSTTLYLARKPNVTTKPGEVEIYQYDPDGIPDGPAPGEPGNWSKVITTDLNTILRDDLPLDHRPDVGSNGRFLEGCGILDFKVKHVNNEGNTSENDKYLLLRDAVRQYIYVLKESNGSGSFELLFYTMGYDASMNAACDKLVVSACNNSTTTGSSSTFNPARTADLWANTRTGERNLFGLFTLPDGTHNNWFNTSLFSIPDSPATNAFVEPDVVFSEANGYLLELASCHLVNMEAAGNAFVFTPSRRFRNDNSDLIMGMCQYIHPSRRTGFSSEEIKKRRGSKTLYQTYVHAGGQFKTGWNCRKSDLFYAKDIPSRGIRSNFLNSPAPFFHIGPDSYPLHNSRFDKPQIVLSHPVDIALENSLSYGESTISPHIHQSLNNNIDYIDPPGYEVAFPFYRYPNVLYKSENEASLSGPDHVVVMNERFPIPKESTNDRGMLSNRNTDKSYVTERNEDFHRLSRPGKVFLFKYTNYHGWSYRKMIPDRNGTFPNQTEIVDARQSSYLPPGLDRLTGHNVTGKPGLDSGALGETFVQDDRVFDRTVGSLGGFVSPFGATGPHTQHGDYGDAGKFCRFVNTIDPAINPRDVHKTYYIRDYKTMVFSDRSKNYPTAKMSDGTYRYRDAGSPSPNVEFHNDIHTFFIKSGLESKPHRRGIQYIPFYQNSSFATTPDLLDLVIIPEDNCTRWPYIPFPFHKNQANKTINGDNVSQLGFSYLFQSPLLTTAAGESMGAANPLFQGLDTPNQYLSFTHKRYHPPLSFIPIDFTNRRSIDTPFQYFQLVKSKMYNSHITGAGSSKTQHEDWCDAYILPRRQFRIKAVHIRDDGTEDVAFSEIFYMNVFNRSRKSIVIGSRPVVGSS